MSRLYLGLVHHPIINKRGDTVTTSVTNLDIHDIARSCKTFGVKGYFIITPLEAQQGLVKRILGHWESDEGNDYNPDRSDALALAQLQNSVAEAVLKITEIEGIAPEVSVTGANFSSSNISDAELQMRLNLDNVPHFILFGTGWGLHASLVEKADFRLSPLKGASNGYNHLSVRSAVAIYLDRLMTRGL